MNVFMFEDNSFGFKRDGSDLQKGSLKEMVLLATKYGISVDDLEWVLNMMVNLGHSRANFGYGGTLYQTRGDATRVHRQCCKSCVP